MKLAFYATSQSPRQPVQTEAETHVTIHPFKCSIRLLFASRRHNADKKFTWERWRRTVRTLDALADCSLIDEIAQLFISNIPPALSEVTPNCTLLADKTREVERNVAVLVEAMAHAAEQARGLVSRAVRHKRKGPLGAFFCHMWGL